MIGLNDPRDQCCGPCDCCGSTGTPKWFNVKFSGVKNLVPARCTDCAAFWNRAEGFDVPVSDPVGDDCLWEVENEPCVPLGYRSNIFIRLRCEGSGSTFIGVYPQEAGAFFEMTVVGKPIDCAKERSWPGPTTSFTQACDWTNATCTLKPKEAS